MSGAIISNNYRYINLFNTLTTLNNGDDLYYLGIGRSNSWVNDLNPPTPDISYNEEIEARNNLQSIKKIIDVTYAAPRYDWISGTTYDIYDSKDASLNTKRYYVLDPNSLNVYICLRSGNSTSTILPTGIDDNPSNGGTTGVAGSATPVMLSDGYMWKYLYTISSSNANKYLTTNYMPVLRDSTVASNSIFGAIYNIKITDGGSGYTSLPSIIISGNGSSASATAILTNGVVTGITISNFGSNYTKAKVSFTGGNPTNVAAAYPIISPVNFGRELTGASIINPGSGYSNGSLLINGDGFNAAGTYSVTNGGISSINISNGGYHYTNTVLIPVDGPGSGASLKPEFSTQKGGFGYDPVIDLNALYLMFNVVLVGDENPTTGFNGDFIPANDYRQLIILKNPKTLISPISNFNALTGMMMNSMVVAPGGTWVLDDIITGLTSKANAIIDYYDLVTETIYFHQNENTGFDTFNDGETLTSNNTSTGSISTLVGSNNILSEADKYSGNLIYLENRLPISRSFSQTEDIKIVIAF